jgi:DNA polymerase III gamma/tau subunit
MEVNTLQVTQTERMARIAEMSMYAPLGTNCRVFILDEADFISDQAQALLRKHFEDGPRSTVWIICTARPDKIDAALKRRCKNLELSGLCVFRRIPTAIPIESRHRSDGKHPVVGA